MTLVDTNVLLDVATDDPKWARWSLCQLDAAAMRGSVLINAIVYAEFSIVAALKSSTTILRLCRTEATAIEPGKPGN